MENVVTVKINRKPSFTEIWYEGSVNHDGKDYMFWLINPRGLDDQGREYEMEVRWWFKQVPREIRAMSEKIITVDKVDYNVTDEETIHMGDELIFEIKINRSSDSSFNISFIPPFDSNSNIGKIIS